MKKFLQTKAIVTTGLLLALMIVLQTIGNYLQIGPANINLSLVPVVLAGILCGPISAAILGFFNGIMAVLSPSTIAIFMPINPVATVLVCLLKCTLAGVISSLVYELLTKKNVPNTVGALIASPLVPIVNTGIFCIVCLLFFKPFLESGVSEAFPTTGAFLILGVVGINFIIELVSTIVIVTPLTAILLKREQKSDNK